MLTFSVKLDYDQLTFLLPVIVYELKYLAIPVNWCWVPASCAPMVDYWWFYIKDKNDLISY